MVDVVSVPPFFLCLSLKMRFIHKDFLLGFSRNLEVTSKQSGIYQHVFFCFLTPYMMTIALMSV